MDLFFRSQCVGASVTRTSLTMIFPADAYNQIETILQRLVKEPCNVPVQSPVPTFDAHLNDKATFEDLKKRGLARDRVALTALVVAAEMEKHNVHLTPDEVAACKRRPALLRRRFEEAEASFFERHGELPNAEDAKAFQRTAAAHGCSDPQFDARIGRQCATLRMSLFTRTRAENMLQCHSYLYQMTGKHNLLDGMGQSAQVRKLWDDNAGNEIFVQFHFASPDHALLQACTSEDGAVATAEDTSLGTASKRRNVFKRRVPAAVTYHNKDGSILTWSSTGFNSESTNTVLWVADAAALMNALHASAKPATSDPANLDYLWAEKNLW